jgi:hypothetical protein
MVTLRHPRHRIGDPAVALLSRVAGSKDFTSVCARSATFGLQRTAAGDQAFHAGLYILIVTVSSAVLVGLLIRAHAF